MRRICGLIRESRKEKQKEPVDIKLKEVMENLSWNITYVKHSLHYTALKMMLAICHKSPKFISTHIIWLIDWSLFTNKKITSMKHHMFKLKFPPTYQSLNSISVGEKATKTSKHSYHTYLLIKTCHLNDHCCTLRASFLVLFFSGNFM